MGGKCSSSQPSPPSLFPSLSLVVYVCVSLSLSLSSLHLFQSPSLHLHLPPCLCLCPLRLCLPVSCCLAPGCVEWCCCLLAWAAPTWHSGNALTSLLLLGSPAGLWRPAGCVHGCFHVEQGSQPAVIPILASLELPGPGTVGWLWASALARLCMCLWARAPCHACLGALRPMAQCPPQGSSTLTLSLRVSDQDCSACLRAASHSTSGSFSPGVRELSLPVGWPQAVARAALTHG